MNLVPFKKKGFLTDPFDSFEDIRDEISHFFKPMSKLMGGDVGLFQRECSPAIDVYDSDNEVLVKADIPGMKKDEIDVSIHGDVLTIKGEKKQENEVRKENYLRSERYYGSFSRSIELPSEVKQDKVNATYKDGVLELRLPKKEESKTRHISVDFT